MAGGLSGLTAITGSVAAAELSFQRSVLAGDPGQPEDPFTLQVEAFTVNGSPIPGDRFYDAMELGLDQLHEQLGDWYDGSRLRCWHLDTDLQCGGVDAMGTALDNASTSGPSTPDLSDRNRLYHFAYPCDQLIELEYWEGVSIKTISPRYPKVVWGELPADGTRPISSVNDLNHDLDSVSGWNNYQVRAVHEAAHMLIDSEIAQWITAVDEPYKAKHALGTVDDQGRRTVMADYDGGLANYLKDDYEDEAKAGVTCGSDYEGSTTWPQIDDLQFSACTRRAMRLSALKHGLGREVTPPPVGRNRNDPRDPDDDGLFEDVNGNGDRDLADSVDLQQNRDTAAVRNWPGAYDFSGNGDIDLADVVELYQENLKAGKSG